LRVRLAWQLNTLAQPARERQGSLSPAAAATTPYECLEGQFNAPRTSDWIAS
jgi:hypothetical protein